MSLAQLLATKQQTIICCQLTDTCDEAARVLANNRIGAMPVLDGSDLVGIFSERDLLYRIAREGAGALTRHVHQVMTAPVISVSKDTSVLTALGLMTKRHIRHLPVVDETGMIAFLSIGDLVKYRIDSMEGEVKAMREYILTA